MKKYNQLVLNIDTMLYRQCWIPLNSSKWYKAKGVILTEIYISLQNTLFSNVIIPVEYEITSETLTK